MQRETIVIRLRSYCLPLYLVGNHFERYYASSPCIAPAPFSSKNFSNENYSDRSFQNNIPTNIIDTIRHYHATYTHHFFFLLNIPNSQWSKFVATDGAQSYKITKANEQATNKKKKKNEGKKEKEREKERESSQLQRSFWPKYSLNFNGTLVDTRGVKNSARRRRNGIRRRGRFENRSRSHVVKLSVRLCLKISVVAF